MSKTGSELMVRRKGGSPPRSGGAQPPGGGRGRKRHDLDVRGLYELPEDPTREDAGSAHDVEGTPAVRPWGARSRALRDRLLFALNFLVAAVGLVALSPVMLVIAVAIKLDSPGPVIFRQLRVGLDRRDRDSDPMGGRRSDDLGGRPFFIHKFRTMHVDAEEETGPVWASKEDDRCTRVGRFLRKYRLDELPQLWNVLRGDMSVVGPRPERPAYVRELSSSIEEYRSRQKVRPGITGWAQINQGYDSSFDDVRRKVAYDMDYMQRRSIWLDMQIMLRTPMIMARWSGRENPENDRMGEPAE